MWGLRLWLPHLRWRAKTRYVTLGTAPQLLNSNSLCALQEFSRENSLQSRYYIDSARVDRCIPDYDFLWIVICVGQATEEGEELWA